MVYNPSLLTKSPRRYTEVIYKAIILETGQLESLSFSSCPGVGITTFFHEKSPSAQQKTRAQRRLPVSGWSVFAAAPCPQKSR
jgi:hypothetical protein